MRRGPAYLAGFATVATAQVDKASAARPTIACVPAEAEDTEFDEDLLFGGSGGWTPSSRSSISPPPSPDYSPAVSETSRRIPVDKPVERFAIGKPLVSDGSRASEAGISRSVPVHSKFLSPTGPAAANSNKWRLKYLNALQSNNIQTSNSKTIAINTHIKGAGCSSTETNRGGEPGANPTIQSIIAKSKLERLHTTGHESSYANSLAAASPRINIPRAPAPAKVPLDQNSPQFPENKSVPIPIPIHMSELGMMPSNRREDGESESAEEFIPPHQLIERGCFSLGMQHHFKHKPQL